MGSLKSTPMITKLDVKWCIYSICIYYNYVFISSPERKTVWSNNGGGGQVGGEQVNTAFSNNRGAVYKCQFN